MNDRIREILSWYGSDNAGTRTNLARLLNHGRLAGTGRRYVAVDALGAAEGQLVLTAAASRAWSSLHRRWAANASTGGAVNSSTRNVHSTKFTDRPNVVDSTSDAAAKVRMP